MPVVAVRHATYTRTLTRCGEASAGTYTQEGKDGLRTMKALKATVTVILDPRVIGPEATTEWGGPHADANASDWMSAVMREANGDTVLDWRYTEHWTEIEVGDPEQYEEDDAFAPKLYTPCINCGMTLAQHYSPPLAPHLPPPALGRCVGFASEAVQP